jgi:two-component system, response regulator
MPVNGPQVKILVVEDNPDDAELTILALEKHHFADHLLWLKSSSLALDFIFQRGVYADRFGQQPPLLILLDLHLPRVDGFELLARIRADPRTQETPVVVLSSSAEEQDVRRSYDLGANGYVTKPLEFDEFAAIIGQIATYWLRASRSVTA